MCEGALAHSTAQGEGFLARPTEEVEGRHQGSALRNAKVSSLYRPE